ncbi:MAG: hypothetical protein SO075_04935 [Eubacteriales bacterium]|nr:hypothetical protein [Eubacteriales bacterium]
MERIDTTAVKVCPNCGGKVIQPKTGRRRKFCSEQCRREWWSAHPEDIMRQESANYHLTCAYCGRPFISYGNKDRKYCCHSCYIHDRFWRAEENRKTS